MVENYKEFKAMILGLLGLKENEDCEVLFDTESFGEEKTIKENFFMLCHASCITVVESTNSLFSEEEVESEEDVENSIISISEERGSEVSASRSTKL